MIALNKTILIFEEADPARRTALQKRYPDFRFIYSDNPDWIKYLPQTNTIIGFIDAAHKDKLKNLTHLELVQLPFAGYESWPEAVSCPLANASGIYGLAVSEYLIGAILNQYRYFPLLKERQYQKIWDPKLKPIQSISQKTILVLGCGDLGSTFAKKAKALGAYTIGAATNVRPIEGFDEVITLDQLDDYLGKCDILVSTLPSNEKTRYLLDIDSFRKMKPTAMFINVGRGDLVSLKTLEDVMDQKLISSMVLDVFETEPLPADSSLWQNEQVMITPPISGDFSLPETKELLWNLVNQNLDALQNKTPFVNVVSQ